MRLFHSAASIRIEKLYGPESLMFMYLVLVNGWMDGWMDQNKIINGHKIFFLVELLLCKKNELCVW